ncbi:DNA polymerase I [Parvibium lacunae]|uniref:DNA polymerase I n=1 Tax=Parvibium lacunae TaxID=1888893 RepID=A0A368L6D3_9BURK|nr:DNA polymerase I [Parvibium lacunae]RCS59248.1 DNA polymerase I [Parvibium lacunae]
MSSTLLLVDGSSYLYRAFHALPDLRNPAGEPTGALYGMINMLRRLRSEYKAENGFTHGAVVFDAKGKTFRDDWYPEYKAHRPPMPDDLVQQIEPIHAAVRALGWPLLMIDGVEADDVIGTLARYATEHGLKTLISTGDKDLAQLVNEHVTLVNTMSNETLDVTGVTEKFGVPPDRIIDYLTLMGDTVDNVPGVTKVGPKTAVKWLTQYGSLEGVIENAANITGVVGENLRQALDWLPTGRRLVTVKCDCDLSAYVQHVSDQLGFQTQDNDTLRSLFERYGFKTWLREISAQMANSSAAAQGDQSDLFGTASTTTSASASANNAPAGLPATPTSLHYHTVDTEAGLLELLVTLDAAALTAFDTETTSLDAMQAELVGLSFATTVGTGWYVPVGHRSDLGTDAPKQLAREWVLAQLRPWLENPCKLKVGQHLKYDTHVLQNYGIQLTGIAHDTLLQSYVLEAHRNHNMDALADRHLGRKTLTYEEVAGKGAQQISFAEVPIDTATRYAAEDAEITLHLHETLWPQIEHDAKLRYVYEQIELPTARVLQVMERNGVLIDHARLQQQSHEIGLRLLELEQQAYTLAEQPFNLNSPKQLGEILFQKLQLPVVKKTPSGTPSTDEEVLQKLAEDYPLPKILLDYRGLAKLKSTYTDKLPKMINPHTGRVHTNYAQAVAVTGRLASNDPNLQNIPIRTAEGRRIREAFIASPGHVLVAADYSQIELRIMAHISSDASLLKAFADGEDVHRATAAEIFGVTPLEVSNEQRRYAKVINFGLIYGMSAFGLAGNLGIERSAAQSYIDRYFARYPGVAKYMERTRHDAHDQGYVETVFGRRLWLNEINSSNPQRRQGAERAAINAPMQGTAADIVKLAMIAVQNWLEAEKLQSKLIMQVHDELVLDVPEAELSLVKDTLPVLMGGVAQLQVPLLVEIGSGQNWEQAH